MATDKLSDVAKFLFTPEPGVVPSVQDPTIDPDDPHGNRYNPMTPEERIKRLMQTATRIAADRAALSEHRGSHGQPAIRITGCDYDTGLKVALEIARAFDHGEQFCRLVSASAGFVCVWLP